MKPMLIPRKYEEAVKQGFLAIDVLIGMAKDQGYDGDLAGMVYSHGVLEDFLYHLGTVEPVNVADDWVEVPDENANSRYN